jgi:hypothetical protein
MFVLFAKGKQSYQIFVVELLWPQVVVTTVLIVKTGHQWLKLVIVEKI